MKFSKWLRILAVSGCIAAAAVSAGAFSCSDFERSGGGPYKETLDALYENLAAGEGSMISWRVRQGLWRRCMPWDGKQRFRGQVLP